MAAPYTERDAREYYVLARHRKTSKQWCLSGPYPDYETAKQYESAATALAVLHDAEMSAQCHFGICCHWPPFGLRGMLQSQLGYSLELNKPAAVSPDMLAGMDDAEKARLLAELQGQSEVSTDDDGN